MLDKCEYKLTFAYKSVAFTPVIHFINKYIFNDWDMLISIIILILVDGVAMIIRSFFDDLYTTEKGLKSFGLKTVSVGLTLMGLSLVDLATIGGQRLEVLSFINTGFYTMLFAFLSISIFTHAYNIHPWEPLRILIENLTNLFNKPKDK